MSAGFIKPEQPRSGSYWNQKNCEDNYEEKKTKKKNVCPEIFFPDELLDISTNDLLSSHESFIESITDEYGNIIFDDEESEVLDNAPVIIFPLEEDNKSQNKNDQKQYDTLQGNDGREGGKKEEPTRTKLKNNPEKEFGAVIDITSIPITYIKRINNMKISQEIKNLLLANLQVEDLDIKRKKWYESLFRIPFGVYTSPPLNHEELRNTNKVVDYFKNVTEILNRAAYKMTTVKEEIINYIAKCLTSSHPPQKILALQGQAGLGKTHIIKHGIGKALQRPVVRFSMCGIKDVSHFTGFSYTYSTSRYGVLVQTFIQQGIMNPIIFLDELDKISKTDEGNEIADLLIQILDPEQNDDFRDKYFSEFPIDLGKVIFIVAFNRKEDIPPILLDRLDIVEITVPSREDKIVIARDFILKDLMQEIGLTQNDLLVSDEIIGYILDTYTKAPGLRSLKKKLDTIISKVNTLKLIKGSKEVKLSFTPKNFSLPIKLDQELVSLFLASHQTEEDEIPHSMYC